MPSSQGGEVYKRRDRKTWTARWYDGDGKRRERGGYWTKSEARKGLEHELDVLRNGEPARELTLSELVDEYLDQHIAEQSTIDGLGFRLMHATNAFGDLKLDRLRVAELRSWRKRLPEGSAWHAVKALRQVS